MKYAVVTTFPNSAWDTYAQEMLASFRANWDCPIMIVLDDDTLVQPISMLLQGQHPEDKFCIMQDPEYRAFLERNKGKDDPKDYRKQYVRFSHKVFAIDASLEILKDKIDYLIWLDADVITNKKITEQHIKKWRPKRNEIASYLGRKDWTSSETGCVIFNLNHFGTDFIKSWKEMYVTDKILFFPEWTDAYAFDQLRETYGRYRNLSKDIPGRDVFEHSPLAECMTHYKGPRKQEIKPVFSKAATQQPIQHSNAMHGNTFDVSNLGIQTKNCIEHEKIQQNVSTNLKVMNKWIKECCINDEEVVICSAGPSLSADEILPYYNAGVKIVAVKHALKTLLDAGIIPWACILLDPRAHVADFVQYPNRLIKWFVSSMVDPSVSRHLIDCGCDVYGYHALVGAGEQDRIPNGHILLGGGSATATRGISLLYTLGFRKMHLYGYDCCYFKKPDLSEKKENGRMRFEEVTLTAQSWGNRTEVRTFWTEGQFLAQVQEMDKIYLKNSELVLNIHGDGIIPWMHKHQQKLKAWEAYTREKRLNGLLDKPNFSQWLINDGTQ